MINDKYPNIKPSLNLDFANTKTLDPRVTFHRGTPGAYYDGKTYVKAEENLIANSTVLSGWDTTNTTVYDNQSSPDGENTAYKLSPVGSNTTAAILPGVSKGTKAQTFSIYVKMDSPDYTAFAMYWNNSGTTHARFNLLSGQVTLDHGDGHIEASMEDVGDGWWRCVATHSQHSSENAAIYVLVDDTSATDFMRWDETNGPDGIKGLLVWHPQIEYRDTVTAYTPTNGTPVTKYQPQLMFASSNQPRFDHDALTGESKGLLIEESRTNLIEYSEDFSNWSIYNGPLEVTHNTVIAPDGTLAATIIKDISTGSYSGIYESLDINSGDYTSSVFIKQGSSATSSIWIALTVDGMVKQETITWTAGVPTASSIQFIDMGNGWYRAYVTVTSTTSQSMIMYLLPCGFNATYTGTTVFWGAQLEAGSFATSYIKTSGASATRSADNASITGENFSSWYRQDEGSIISDGSIDMNNRKGDGGMPQYTVQSDSGYIALSRDSSYWYHGIVNNGESNYRYWSDVESTTGAITYNYNDGYINSYINKEQNLSSTTWVDREKNIVHEHAEKLRLGAGTGVNNVLNGHIKRFTYYPQQLTNEQLQNLTR